MSKLEAMTTNDETDSLFEARRRLRRVRMIVDLTSSLIANDSSISHREARSLVECAEKAIGELVPSYSRRFEAAVKPRLDSIIRQRWPLEEFSARPELVN